jgi:hypothetical protein
MRDTNTENKPNLPAPRMNLSSFETMNYEQIAMNNANKNKPNQSRSEAEIPKGELLEILKPGPEQNQPNAPATDHKQLAASRSVDQPVIGDYDLALWRR